MGARIPEYGGTASVRFEMTAAPSNDRELCRGRAWSRLAVLVGLLNCSPSSAASPFPAQTFTYSNPPAEVAARISDRAGGRPHGEAPIVVSRGASAASFVFFSTGNDCLISRVYPVIAVFENGRWNTIVFEGAKNHFWSQVYRSYPDGEHMYALSRSSCGDPGGEIYVYRSSDAGRSWKVSSVTVHYLSRFVALRMARDGTGEITVEADLDAGLPGGHHVYRTSDWGDTWAEAEFSETMLLFPDLPGNYASEDVPIEVSMKRIAPNPTQ